MSSIAIATTRAGDRGVGEADVLLRRVADAGRVADEHHRRRAARRRARRRRGRRSTRPAARGRASSASPAQRQRERRSSRERRRLGVRRDPRSSARRRALGALARDPRELRQPALDLVAVRRAHVDPHLHAARRSSSGRWARSAIRDVVTVTPSRELLGRDDQPRGGRPARRGAPPAASCRRDRRAREARPRAARRAASELTIPTGAPARATSVLWSMWISKKPDRRVAPRRRASTTPPGSIPAPRIASATDTPWSSRARQHAVDVELSGERLAAERRRVEARALLVGERDHGDRLRRGRRDLKPARDAERPVVATAAADAVQVRADPPPRRLGLRARPQVPGRIARHAQPACAPPDPRTTPCKPRPPPSTPAASTPCWPVPIAVEAREPRGDALRGDHRTLRTKSGRTYASEPPAITAATGLRPNW